MIIVILGAPGSGKGTHAKTLSRIYNVPHISTGDIFRNYIKRHNELGKEIEEYMNSGHLVPNELTAKILTHRLSEQDCENGFVLDGYPRTFDQVEYLTKILTEMKLQIDLVINLDVDDEIIKDRIVNRLVCDKCREIYNLKNKKPINGDTCNVCGSKLTKRHDDTEEAVVERLHIYHENAKAILEFYKANNTYIDVKGHEKIEETIEELISKLNKGDK